MPVRAIGTDAGGPVQRILASERGASWLVGITIAVVYGRPLDDFSAPGLGISLGQLVLLGSFAFLVARGVRGGSVGKWRAGVVLISMYWVMGLVSMLYAADVTATKDELTDVVQNSVVLIVILLGIDGKARLRVAIWAFIISAAIVAAVNLYQLATGTFDSDYWGLAATVAEPFQDQFDIRISGPGLGPNGLAHALTFCIPFAVNRFESERSWALRALALVAVALLVIGTIFTYSRNGFLTLVLIGALIAVYRRVPVRRILTIGLIGFAGLLMLAPGQYTERLSTLVKLGSAPATVESRSVGRSSEYLAAIQMYIEHPVVGVGLGNYPSRYLEYSEQIGLDTRREDRAPHSLYLQFAAELGAVGLAWLAFVIVAALLGLSRARHLTSVTDRDGERLLVAVEIAFLAFLAFSLFRHIALHRYFMMPVALALAAPSATLATVRGAAGDLRGPRGQLVHIPPRSFILLLFVGVCAAMLLISTFAGAS